MERERAAGAGDRRRVRLDDELVRNRLVERLARRFSARLVTVSGAAGFGKSTLLAQALVENEARPRGRDVLVSCRRSESLLVTLAGACEVPAGDHTDVLEREVALVASRSGPAATCAST